MVQPMLKFKPLFIVYIWSLFFVTTAFARPPIEVIAYQVELVVLPQKLSILGHLQAEKSVSLVASATDRVQKLHYTDGQKVSKNQLLVELNIKEELASLEEIKATVADAKKQYLRVKNITGRAAVTEALIDEKYHVWQTSLAKQKMIEAQIEDRKILAPFDGVIGLSSISEGALVQSGSHIVSIDNNQLMKLDLLIPPAYLKHLTAGLKVAVQTEAYPNEAFGGVVSAISPQLDSATRMVQVRALIDNPDSLLKTNMFVHADINLPERLILRVPNNAILRLGDHQYIYLLEEKAEGRYQANKVEIKTGVIGPAYTEVIQGVNKDDLVVSQGIMRVNSQSTITIKALQNNASQEQLLKLRVKPVSREP